MIEPIAVSYAKEITACPDNPLDPVILYINHRVREEAAQGNTVCLVNLGFYPDINAYSNHIINLYSGFNPRWINPKSITLSW